MKKHKQSDTKKPTKPKQQMVENYFSDTSHLSQEQNNFAFFFFFNLEKLEFEAFGSYLVLKQYIF